MHHRGLVAIILAALAACSHPAAPVPTPPVARPVAAVDDLVLSATGSCGILRDRTALCWGDWDSSLIHVATAAAELTNVVELRIGHTLKLDPQRYYDHLCSRDARGTVRCWGNNQQGQLGAAVTGDAASPFLVELPAIAQLALGNRHSCALGRDGDVYCWGSNEHGQAGAAASTAVVARPRKVGGLDHIVQLAAGAESTCALTTEQRVYCWGDNLNGQSSAAETGVEPVVWTPRELTIARGSDRLAAGRSTLCAVQRGGVVCWGFLGSLLGDEYARRSSGRVPDLADVSALGLGDHHACALVDGGDVWCFGQGATGELGNGAATPEPQPPRKVALPAPATAIAVGATSACARLQDNRWYCWGANRKGELAADKQPVWTPTPFGLAR